MKLDLVLITFGMMAVGLASWFATGNPPRPTRLHADRHLTDDPRVKFITERSEYMRSER